MAKLLMSNRNIELEQEVQNMKNLQNCVIATLNSAEKLFVAV